MPIVNRINKFCEFFPCHKNLQDCAFCYCPFYPCEDEQLGRFLIMKDKREIWSCQDCSWIHSKKVVNIIFTLIRNSAIKNRFKRLKIKNTG